MKKWSIQSRLLIIALAPTLCVGLALSFYFSRQQVIEIENSALDKAQTIASYLARISEFGVVTGNKSLLNTIAKPTLDDVNITAISITNRQGDVLVEAEKPHQENSHWFINARPLFTNNPIKLSLSSDIFTTVLSPTDDYQNDASIDTPKVIGTVSIKIDLYPTSIRQLSILFDSIALTIMAMAVAMILSNWIARTVTHAVRQITHTVDELSSGNLEVRVPATYDGELGRLGQGINHMSQVIRQSRNQLQQEIQKATVDLQTTFKELEQRNEELEEAKKVAERASNFKTQFLANMSHEIRTPINAVLGFSELLIKSAKDPVQRDYLSTIRLSAEGLLGLLNDILDLSKVESGKLTLENIEVNVNSILAEAFSLFSAQAARKEIEFFIQYLHPKDAQVYTDPLRLRQVLINLISNAIKFTNKGHVLIACECVSKTDSINLIEFRIEDTGTGIPADAQTNLFHAFSQGDMSTSRKFGGSGLGLHIANEIIFLMQGEISFDSVLNKGTIFSVKVPLSARTINYNDNDEKIETKLTGPIILIDDYPPLREYYMQSLRAAGFTIADESIPAGNESIVLVNFNLNRLFKGEFKLSDKFPNIPTYAFCFGNNPAIKTRLLQAGYQGVVAKSPDPRRLASDINALINNHSTTPDYPRPPPENKAQNRNSLLHILVVDDHPINLKLADSFCKELGINSQLAPSADIGIDLAKNNAYDIIFMDVHMPNIDGIEATRIIRAESKLNSSTPIIALTADAYQATENELIKSGIQDILVKPISLEIFKNYIEKWSQQKDVLNIAPKKIKNLQQELQSILKEGLPRQRDEIQTALQHNDLEQLEHHAHRLNGASAYCDTPALNKAAKALETSLKLKQYPKVKDCVTTVVDEINRILMGR